MTSNYEGDATSAARRVADAWENSNAKNLKGFFVTDVKGSVIQIGHIRYGSDGEADWVDVWHGKPMGSPAFRLLNPETRVMDRRGDVVIKDSEGRTFRYREDPLQAVAETIAGVRSGN